MTFKSADPFGSPLIATPIPSIDLSPFHFPQDPAHIFIGSKTTSLVGLDLQTGQSVGTFGTNRSTPLGVCKPDGEGLHGMEDGECESDIDDRPEDLLYIGQTGELAEKIHNSVRRLIGISSMDRLPPCHAISYG